MNEQAIKDMYSLAQGEGYTKSIEDFKALLSSNEQALNDMFGVAQNNGYNRSLEDFSVLMGVKKKETDFGQEEVAPSTSVSSDSKLVSTSSEEYPEELKAILDSPMYAESYKDEKLKEYQEKQSEKQTRFILPPPITEREYRMAGDIESGRATITDEDVAIDDLAESEYTKEEVENLQSDIEATAEYRSYLASSSGPMVRDRNHYLSDALNEVDIEQNPDAGFLINEVINEPIEETNSRLREMGIDPVALYLKDPREYARKALIDPEADPVYLDEYFEGYGYRAEGTTTYFPESLRENIRDYQAYSFGKHEKLTNDILLKVYRDASELKKKIDSETSVEEIDKIDELQARVSSGTGYFSDSTQQEQLAQERELQRLSVVEEKYREQRESIRKEILDSLPDELKENEEFIERLDDKIYFETGYALNLDGDDRYDDKPFFDNVGNSLLSGTLSLLSSSGLGAKKFIAAGLPGGESIILEADRQQREYDAFNKEVQGRITQYDRGAFESLMAGDFYNSFEQLSNGVAGSLPELAVTFLTGGRNKAKIFITSGALSAFRNVKSATEALDEHGDRIYTDNQALAYGLSMAPLEAGTDVILGKLFNKGVVANSGKIRLGGNPFTTANGKVVGAYLWNSAVAFNEDAFAELGVAVVSDAVDKYMRGEKFSLAQSIKDGGDDYLTGGAMGVSAYGLGGLKGMLDRRTPPAALAASNSMFDPETQEKLSTIDATIAELNRQASETASMEDLATIQEKADQLRAERENIVATRISFYEVMGVKDPSRLSEIQDLDLEIAKDIAEAKKAKTDKELAMIKARIQKNGIRRQGLVAEFSEGDLTLNAGEQSQLIKQKIEYRYSQIESEYNEAREAYEALVSDAEDVAGTEAYLDFEKAIENAKATLDRKRSALEDAKSIKDGYESAVADLEDQVDRAQAGDVDPVALDNARENVSLIEIDAAEALGINTREYSSNKIAEDIPETEQSKKEKKRSYEAETEEDTDKIIDEALEEAETEADPEAEAEVEDLEADLEADLEDRRSDTWVRRNLEEQEPTSLTQEQLEAILASDNYAILTAENPNAQPVSNAKNKRLNDEAREWLRKNNLTFHEVKGRYDNGENSFIVEGMTVDQAKEFARKFKQHSAVTPRGLVRPDGAIAPLGDATFDSKLVDGDNYLTAVKLADGSTVVFKRDTSGEYFDGDGNTMAEGDFWKTEAEEAVPTSYDESNLDAAIENGDVSEAVTNEDGSISVPSDTNLSSAAVKALNRMIPALVKSLGVSGVRVVIGKPGVNIQGIGESKGFYGWGAMIDLDAKGGPTIYIDPAQLERNSETAAESGRRKKTQEEVMLEEVSHGVFGEVLRSSIRSNPMKVVGELVKMLGDKSTAVREMFAKARDYTSGDAQFEKMNELFNKWEKGEITTEQFMEVASLDDVALEEGIQDVLNGIATGNIKIKSSVFTKVSDWIKGILEKAFGTNARQIISDESSARDFIKASRRVYKGKKVNVAQTSTGASANTGRYKVMGMWEGFRDGVENLQGYTREQFERMYPDEKVIDLNELPNDQEIEIEYDEHFYRYGKDIGNFKNKRTFNGRDHFTAWWRKVATHKPYQYGDPQARLDGTMVKKAEFSKFTYEGQRIDTGTLEVDKLRWKERLRNKLQINIRRPKNRGKLSYTYNEMLSDMMQAVEDGIMSKAELLKIKKHVKDVVFEGIDLEKKRQTNTAEYAKLASKMQNWHNSLNKKLQPKAEKANIDFKYDPVSSPNNRVGYSKYRSGGGESFASARMLKNAAEDKAQAVDDYIASNLEKAGYDKETSSLYSKQQQRLAGISLLIGSKLQNSTATERATELMKLDMSGFFGDSNVTTGRDSHPLFFFENSKAAVEKSEKMLLNALGVKRQSGYGEMHDMVFSALSNGNDTPSTAKATMYVISKALLHSRKNQFRIPDSLILEVENGESPISRFLNNSRRKNIAKQLRKINEFVDKSRTKNGTINPGALRAMIMADSKKNTKISNRLSEIMGGVGKIGGFATALINKGEARVAVIDKHMIDFHWLINGDFPLLSNSIPKQVRNKMVNLLNKHGKKVAKGEDVSSIVESTRDLMNELGKDHPDYKDLCHALKDAKTTPSINKEEENSIRSLITDISDSITWQDILNSLPPDLVDKVGEMYGRGDDFRLPEPVVHQMVYYMMQSMKGHKYTDNATYIMNATESITQNDISDVDSDLPEDWVREIIVGANDVDPKGILFSSVARISPGEIATQSKKMDTHTDEMGNPINQPIGDGDQLMSNVSLEPTSNFDKAFELESVEGSVYDINGETVTSDRAVLSSAVEVFFDLLYRYPVDKAGRLISKAENLLKTKDGRMFVSGKVTTEAHSGNVAEPRGEDGYPSSGKRYNDAISRLSAYLREQGVVYGSRADVEAIYNTLSPEAKAKLYDENSYVSRVSASAQSRRNGQRIRQTAGKAAKRFNDQRSKILENPENYISTQNINENKQRLEQMSEAELIDIMTDDALGRLSSRNDDLGVLAGAELLNRAQKNGETDKIPGLIEELAKIGTTAGRILRHFRELKGATSKGLAQIIEASISKKGNSLSAEQRAELQNVADEFFEAQKEYERLRKEAIAGKDVETDLKKAHERLKSAERALSTFSNKYVEKGWGDIYTMLVQGNLLTVKSQVVNVGANLVNLFGKMFVDAIALPTEKLINLFGVESDYKRRYSLNAYLEGVKGFGRGLSEATSQIITGQDPEITEWRMERGFMPIRSLFAALSKNDLPLKGDKASVSQRAKLFVQGTLGIPAEVMFRFLSLGDTPFRRAVEGVELYQIGRDRGLRGEALKRFIKYPPMDAMELAKREGRKLTFQEDTDTSRMAEAGVNGIINALGKGFSVAFGDKVIDPRQVAKAIIRTTMPYVRTPANILSETLTFISPYYATLRIARDLRNGDARGASQNFGKVMIGSIASQLAIMLIKEGLISGEIEWDEDEEKNLAYDQFPPSSINVDGLKRFLNGEDPSKRPDDYFVKYDRLGIIGTLMGSIVKGVDKEELKKRDYSGMKFLHHTVADAFGVGPFSGVSHMLDQSFLQGMDGLLNIITSKDAGDFERASERFMSSTMKAASATALPNTLSQLHRMERDYMPDMRITKDIPMEERLLKNLEYTVKERTFNTDGVPIRVNWKGEPIKQTPRGTNKVFYNIFDITSARQGESDPVSNEMYRLTESVGVVPDVLGTPNYAKKKKIAVPNLSKKAIRAISRTQNVDKEKYTFLDNEEFVSSMVYLNTEQINEVMKISGKERYAELEELLNSTRYSSMTDYEKLEAVNEIEANYNSAIEMDGPRLRPHSVALLDFFQEIYEKERE